MLIPADPVVSVGFSNLSITFTATAAQDRRMTRT